MRKAIIEFRADKIDFRRYLNYYSFTDMTDGEAMIRECKTKDDLEEILSADSNRPLFLFKHSSICPTSTAAREEFVLFADEEEQASFWQVLVRENRDLSLEFADRLDVIHQSPQVILLIKGRAVSDHSHQAINLPKLREMIAEFAV